MNRYFTIIIGLFFLSILFALPGCKSCTGDKDTSGEVRCGGNILAKATSDSSSGTDIKDLIANPKNIPIPDPVRIVDPNDSSKSFQIFETEVTNEQYAQFLEEKGALPGLSKDGEENDCHLDNGKTALCYLFSGEGITAKDPQGDETEGGKAKISDKYAVSPGKDRPHPVTYVSWYAAREFCKVKEWRLPTEKEWKIAAGTLDYPWGTKEPTCGHANFASIAVTSGYCSGDTIDVNAKMAASTDLAELELKHMAGNVSEWTNDSIKDKDKEEDEEDRVIKGGAWDSAPEELKNSARTLRDPKSTEHNLGFRCVK